MIEQKKYRIEFFPRGCMEDPVIIEVESAYSDQDAREQALQKLADSTWDSTEVE